MSVEIIISLKQKKNVRVSEFESAVIFKPSYPKLVISVLRATEIDMT